MHTCDLRLFYTIMGQEEKMMKDQNVINKNSDMNVSPKKSKGFVVLSDPVIICPLNESHRIRMSQLQCHLERCLIGDLVEMTCPRNPLHIVDEASYDHHIKHCQDMPVTVDKSQNQSPDI